MSAHAKLSASGSERWLNCPGSVKLSEDAPPKPDSEFAKEGTLAHELLELWLLHMRDRLGAFAIPAKYPEDMAKAVKVAVNHVKEIWNRKHAELVVEEKISLDFIHPDMFGTADIQIIEDFGTLSVLDYKHGKGKIVEVVERTPSGMISPNTQLIYYALGAAHRHNFDFEKIVISVIQPRATGHPDGVIRSVALSPKELKKYIDLFKRGVDRVYSKNPRLFVGRWCHWCPAKEICPLQENIRAERYGAMFDDDIEDESNFSDMGF